jgi:hypothetical protein
VTDVEVPFSGENTGDDAVLLLAAAEELGFGQSAVRTTAGAFVVPEEVRDKAFAKDEPEEAPKKAPAKKTTAKKTAAKKK